MKISFEHCDQKSNLNRSSLITGVGEIFADLKYFLNPDQKEEKKSSVLPLIFSSVGENR
jgi:hypothetical protein